MHVYTPKHTTQTSHSRLCSCLCSRSLALPLSRSRSHRKTRRSIKGASQRMVQSFLEESSTRTRLFCLPCQQEPYKKKSFPTYDCTPAIKDQRTRVRARSAKRSFFSHHDQKSPTTSPNMTTHLHSKLDGREHTHAHNHTRTHTYTLT